MCQVAMPICCTHLHTPLSVIFLITVNMSHAVISAIIAILIMRFWVATYMKACTVPAGYVHGKSPEICPHGCKPDPNLGQNETAVQTLIREALEFQVTKTLTGCLWGLPT